MQLPVPTKKLRYRIRQEGTAYLCATTHTKGAAREARRAFCVSKHSHMLLYLLVGCGTFIFLSAQAAAQVKCGTFLAKCRTFVRKLYRSEHESHDHVSSIRSTPWTYASQPPQRELEKNGLATREGEGSVKAVVVAFTSRVVDGSFFRLWKLKNKTIGASKTA